MNINFGQAQGQPQRTGTREGTVNTGRTVIGQLKKESEFLNANGDVINPRTKEIIKRNTPDPQ